MTTPGVIRICVFCQILLFGILTAQPARFQQYGRPQLRYQWPPESPPLSRTRLESGRGLYQGSPRLLQRFRDTDFNNDFNNNAGTLSRMNRPFSSQSFQSPIFRQNLRLPARLEQQRRIPTRTSYRSSRRPVTNDFNQGSASYDFTQQQRQIRSHRPSTIITRGSTQTSQALPQIRRSRFESAPIRAIRTQRRSRPSGFRGRQITSGSSGLQTRYWDQGVPRTPRLRQQSARAVSRTLYKSRTPDNPSIDTPGPAQTVQTQSIPEQKVPNILSILTPGTRPRHNEKVPSAPSYTSPLGHKTVDPTEKKVTQAKLESPSYSVQAAGGRIGQGAAGSRLPESRIQPRAFQPPVRHGSFIQGPQLADVHVPRTHKQAVQKTPQQPYQDQVQSSQNTRHIEHSQTKSVQTQSLLTQPIQTQSLLTQPIQSQSQQTHSLLTQSIQSQSQQTHSLLTQPIQSQSQQTHSLLKQPIQSQSQQTHSLLTQPIQSPSQQTHSLLTQPIQSQSQQTHSLLKQPIQSQSQQTHSLLTQPIQSQSQQTHSLLTQPIQSQSQQTHSLLKQPIQSQSQQTHSLLTQPIQSQSQQTHSLLTQPIQFQSQQTQFLLTQPLKAQSVHARPVQTQPIHTQPVKTQSLQTPSLQTQSVQQSLVPQHQTQHNQPPIGLLQPIHQTSYTQSQLAPVQTHTVQHQAQSVTNSLSAAQTPLVSTNLGLRGQVSNPSPVQAQPQVATNASQTLHDELVAVLVAALEGRLSSTAVSQPAAQSPYGPSLQHAAQSPYGTNLMHAVQSPYGPSMQYMYPAHMYPAYMQEMMFGDTQDPPDPTQPTPNVTTAVPDVTTATSDVTTAIPDVTTSLSEPVPITEGTVDTTVVTSPDVMVTDMTTDYVAVDTTTESSTAGYSTTLQPDTSTETLVLDPAPVATDIPLPYEQKGKQPVHIDSKLLTVETPAIQTIEKLKTMFKAAQALRGKLTTSARDRLLTGIRGIIQKSNVDLATLKDTLNNQVNALKASVINDATPTVTDSPPPSRDTTLAPPTMGVTASSHPETTTMHVSAVKHTSTQQQISTTKQPIRKVKSLVDNKGGSKDTVVLQSILKEIAVQSKGKQALPNELKSVNFKTIADSLVPKGTDLATQLADPNFIKLLREIVSKLHSFANVTEVTTTLPEMTTTHYFTTTGEYEI